MRLAIRILVVAAAIGIIVILRPKAGEHDVGQAKICSDLANYCAAFQTNRLKSSSFALAEGATNKARDSQVRSLDDAVARALWACGPDFGGAEDPAWAASVECRAHCTRLDASGPAIAAALNANCHGPRWYRWIFEDHKLGAD